MGCFSIFHCFTSSKQSKPVNPITSPHQGCTNNRDSVLINAQSLQIPNCKSSDSKISAIDLIVEIENNNKKEKQSNYDSVVQVKIENEIDEENDSSVSSYISYPPIHQDRVVILQDSSESLFSLSIGVGSTKVNDNEVNSPLKTNSPPELIAKTIRSLNNENDYNQTIDLLNPIENLAQWKTTKIENLNPNQEKENIYLEQEDINIPLSEDPIFKVSDTNGKSKNNTAVTTSLSSWLVDPEKSKSKSMTVSKEESQHSTGNSNAAYAYSDGAISWKSFEDRPILGAWTIYEVKQISARSSPRKSPCRNPDEMPIIGTVGSYWSHSMEVTDSSSSCTSPFGVSVKSRRNRENKALRCHSSTTKRRLDNKTAV